MNPPPVTVPRVSVPKTVTSELAINVTLPRPTLAKYVEGPLRMVEKNVNVPVVPLGVPVPPRRLIVVPPPIIAFTKKVTLPPLPPANAPVASPPIVVMNPPPVSVTLFPTPASSVMFPPLKPAPAGLSKPSVKSD